ncbi:MAG TPA: hypothetical protein VLB83_00060 [Candidatus Paceibacterota bacterium]|nr:hypothetical protein [Candidatus Paceibacterota bacterium]
MFHSFRIALLLALLAAPLGVSAHERQLFTIGDTDYLFVVGSIGEPVVVDDKSGVELRVKLADPADPTNANAASATPALGFEKTVKVEIIAGAEKKTLDLTPAHGEPGLYRAVFFPTVETTLTYRFFGTIGSTSVDLGFTCNPAGHVAAPEDRTPTPITEGVVRKFKAGQFGCPQAKGPLGFPEASMTVQDLHADAEHHMGAMMSDVAAQEPKVNSALAIALVALAIAAGALWKASRTPSA